ncbi:MAG: hypothetical protein FK734_03625 [Asgard group archaeon]|nr:hypothetical protein [Asgard group archaeon]
MGIIIINVELSLLEYCLAHIALYFIIQLLVFTITALDYRYRKNLKRIKDARANISFSLMVSSIVTGLLIPIITYVTQFDYWFNAHWSIYWNQQEEYRIMLFTILLPFLFYLICSVLTYYWNRTRKNILKKEFRKNKIQNELGIN